MTNYMNRIIGIILMLPIITLLSAVLIVAWEVLLVCVAVILIGVSTVIAYWFLTGEYDKRSN